MSASDEEGSGRTKVIALVTSAGGLDALSGVLRALPKDLPAAVVVAQHLGGQGSVLVDILARRISLPVVWAQPNAPRTWATSVSPWTSPTGDSLLPELVSGCVPGVPGGAFAAEYGAGGRLRPQSARHGSR
jgi:hypothetical protein